MRSLPATLLLTVGLLSACTEMRSAEDPSAWFDDGSSYDVVEPVAFTTEPYGLPAEREVGIGELDGSVFRFEGQSFGTNVAAEDFTEGISACEDWFGTDELPVTVTGVVTAHPRFYFKTTGCNRDDEKYYGSYWIEDDTGGMFVLGDSKVAHFDMGQTVTLRIRAARRSFDLNMVYAHDVLEVDREVRPIKYVEVARPLGDDDVGEVRRVTGTIVRAADDFGEVLMQPEGYDGTCTETPDGPEDCVVLTLDIELSRRGLSFEPGERVTVTGPVLYSYSTYGLVLTRLGQIERLVD